MKLSPNGGILSIIGAAENSFLTLHLALSFSASQRIHFLKRYKCVPNVTDRSLLLLHPLPSDIRLFHRYARCSAWATITI